VVHTILIILLLCQKPNYYLIIIQPTDEQNKIEMWHNVKKSDSINFYFFYQKHSTHQNFYKNLMQTLLPKLEHRTC